eukprot:TRINITY_DN11964_c1_g1_i1.p1 TRINITY_DN11964_c1_g1~~TRINITY_DN11964_c1_g1_i1.p1  ORF type:complete len:202 (-),score=13.05 TRINITY_DN11964_c1_g1_i1:236-841(-)
MFGFKFIRGGPVDCCSSKTVGTESYTLVTSDVVMPSECVKSCIYQRDGQLEKQLYCFAPGHLPVVCTEISENLESSKNPKGPFGNLFNAVEPFTDLDIAFGPITTLTIYNGSYSNFPNVITGIQTTYGSKPSPIRGNEGNGIASICTANPNNGIFFAQISGTARTKDDVNSIIFSLAFANSEGVPLCVPPLAGDSLNGGQI